MPVYIAPSDIVEYLKQLQPLGSLSDDDVLLLTKLGLRSTAIIDRFLGFAFTDHTEEPTDKIVTGWGTSFLMLPPHLAGSITAVEYEDGTVIPVADYTEQEDGSLYLDNTYGYWYPYGGSLRPGWGFHRYTVTAKWGVGPVPEDVKEVALELAVNLWREKDKGHFSDVVGVEGGGAIAVGYTKALTNRQQMILDLVRSQYSREVVV